MHETPLFLHGRRFQMNSVLKIGFYGTDGIFGVRKGLLWYAMRFQWPPVHENPLLLYGSASSVRETAPARKRANIKKGVFLGNVLEYTPIFNAPPPL